jgi:hypothetical protein
MIDLATLLGFATSGATAIASAANAVSSVREAVAKDSTASPELKADLSNLLDQIIAAKQMNIFLIAEIEKTRNELVQEDRFEKLISSYRMVKTKTGSIVYQLDSEVDAQSPVHYICTNCVEQKLRSILQGNEFYKLCNSCKAGFTFDRQEMPSFESRSVV